MKQIYSAVRHNMNNNNERKDRRKGRVGPRIQHAHGHLGPSLVFRSPEVPASPSRLGLRALSNYDLASVFEESDFLGLEIPEQMMKAKEDPKTRVR